MKLSMASTLAAIGVASLAAIAFSKQIHTAESVSSLTYTLVHPMHVIHGTSNKVACTVDLTEDTLASAIACSAPLNTFDTRNENRDSHMLEVVEGLRYPEVSFAGKPVKREGGNWVIAGDVHFHGQTRPIQFPVTTTHEGENVRVKGQFPISLTDFHIPRPSLLFVKTEDTVRIDVDIVSKP